MNKKKQRLYYLMADYLSANAAWFVYDVLRFYVIGQYLGYQSVTSFLSQSSIWGGQLLFPIFWIILFFYSGYYNKPFRKSRVQEFLITFSSVFIGAMVIFFVFVLDDLPPVYTIYYKMILMLIVIQFVFTYIPRAIITQRVASRIYHRQWGFRTLIIGTGEKAAQLTHELNGMNRSLGHLIVGYCRTGNETCRVDSDKIIGSFDQIDSIISSQKIQEILIAEDKPNYDNLYSILHSLFRFNLPIRITADRYDILTGNARMSTTYGTPMINITGISMPDWQQNIKITADYLLSFLCLVFTSPLFLYFAWRIKKESPGPVFYKQERIGQYGKPFFIYKFRSMYVNAEKESPLLAKDDDPRVTPFGKIMRKYRLDELPQFWNVLKGEMSIVGPRPERSYFVEQIIQKAPFYYTIQSVRPGITSWGMVKYGYADTVEKMVERLYFDIIYIESMSLLIDIKIIAFTIRTVITGKGV